jgi:RNA polymerase sigma-70 factor (ECF subfamily)
MMEHAGDEADEQVLLQRFIQGDSLVFWAIWAPYQKELFSHCLRWMDGNREEAEDALHDASLKAWQHLPRYAQEHVNVKAWLLKLLYNHCIDMIRSCKRRHRLKHQMSTLSLSTPAWQPLVRESPEEVVSRQEVLQAVRHALDNLPPGLQDTAELRLVCDLPYNEIAIQLQISPENARKRVQQARAMLQTSLAEYRSGDTRDLASTHAAEAAA